MDTQVAGKPVRFNFKVKHELAQKYRKLLRENPRMDKMEAYKQARDEM